MAEVKQASDQSQAVTTIQQKPLALAIAGKSLSVSPTAAKILLTKTAQGWDAQEIATLGESDLFVVREKSGAFRGFKKYVTLYESKKEIANFEGGSWMITVAGYNRLNQIGALHTITPPIYYEGKEYPNPYPILGPSGEIRKYVSRKIVLGFSPTGNLVAVDAVRYYDLEAYYLQTLLAKAKKTKDAAQLASEYSCPFAPGAEIQEKDGTGQLFCKSAKGKVYIFKRLKDDEAIGIWIDVSHEEIFAVYKEHTQHMKFGDVISQTVCDRNAKKAHPAIATTTVTVTGSEKNHTAQVLVYGFISQLSQEKIAEIGGKITRGEAVDGVVVETLSEEITEEEAAVELNQAAGEEEAGDTASAPAPAESPAPQPQAPETVSKNTPVTPTPAPKQKTQEADPLDAQIAKIAQEKGIDLPKFVKNLFDFTKPFESLNHADKEKLLGIIKAADAAPNKKGAK